MAPSTDQGRAAAAHVNAGDHGFTQAQALFGPEVADASVPVRPRNVARKSIGGGEVTGLPGAPEGEAPTPDKHPRAMPAFLHVTLEFLLASRAQVKRRCVASAHCMPSHTHALLLRGAQPFCLNIISGEP